MTSITHVPLSRRDAVPPFTKAQASANGVFVAEKQVCRRIALYLPSVLQSSMIQAISALIVTPKSQSLLTSIVTPSKSQLRSSVTRLRVFSVTVSSVSPSWCAFWDDMEATQMTQPHPLLPWLANLAGSRALSALANRSFQRHQQ